MVPLSYFHQRRQRVRGPTRSSALILALIFIGLISVLVVGFLTTMRVETSAAHSHLGGVQADIYADAGKDIAMGKLYTAFYTPLQGAATTFNPTNYWVSQPGRIYTCMAGNSSVTNYDLSSGGWSAASPPTSDQGVDLNPVSYEAGGRILSATNGGLYLRWIYQHQDGTVDPATPPVYQAANPVVGRFAYWVDDEGAKINLNTAWDRSGNGNILSHPSQINLEAISTADAAAIHSYRSAGTYFASVAEAGRAGVSTATSQNSFSLTAFNHSADLNAVVATGSPSKPDLNMFGEQRIMLTTQASLAAAAGCTNFLDILTTPNTDPGNYSSLSSSKVNTTVAKLYGALNRADFPFLLNKSAVNKYGSTLSSMIALNIIEYVRSAESTNQFIVSMRGDVSGTGFVLSQTGAMSSNCGRKPYITATGAVIKSYTAGTATYDTLFSVYVPPVIPGGNNTDIAIRGTNIYLWDALEHTPTQKVDSVLSGSIGNVNGVSADGLIHGGQYATLIHTWTQIESAKPSTIGQIGSLAVNSYASHINAKITDSFTNSISLPGVDHTASPTDIPLTSTANDSDSTITAYEITDDPAANNWQTANSPLSTAIFGTPWHHTTTLGNVASTTVTPRVDSDVSGHVANGMFVPAPKGTSSNPNGVVSSVAELGFIPTSGNKTGVNWRTLRLQPQYQTGTLPDWALLDLFTVPQQGAAPAPADQPYLQPYNVTAVPYAGGKININNAAYQLVDSSTSLPVWRPLPLEALVLGATNSFPDPNLTVPTAPTVIGTSLAATLATNIAFGLPATGGVIYGTNAVANSTNFYWSPYQVAEIKGVADSGEGSEIALRQLCGLLTTHSDVFTIYSVGQSIRQTATGIVVLGERRKESVVERFVNSSGAVVLQPVGSKDMLP